MSNIRQYMSQKQEMIGGPTRGDQARGDIQNKIRTDEADKKVKDETARREAREDKQRDYDYQRSDANRAKDQQRYDTQRAQDLAREQAYQNQQQQTVYNPPTPVYNQPQPSPSPSPRPSPSPSPRPSPSPSPSAPAVNIPLPPSSPKPPGANDSIGNAARQRRIANRQAMKVSERRAKARELGMSMQDFNAGKKG